MPVLFAVVLRYFFPCFVGISLALFAAVIRYFFPCFVGLSLAFLVAVTRYGLACFVILSLALFAVVLRYVLPVLPARSCAFARCSLQLLRLFSLALSRLLTRRSLLNPVSSEKNSLCPRLLPLTQQEIKNNCFKLNPN